MLASLFAVPAQADDAAWPASGFESELGMRYWLSWGKTAKNLYGATRAVLNSRLTYSGLAGNAGEIFGQISDNGFFTKGFAGLGVIGSGNLQDEDFPPGISPYSSTDSPQRRGAIDYLTIDAGYSFMQTPNSRIGGFIGYSYLNEEVKGYGCTQTASNTSVCATTISAATRVITQNNNWHSLRLGVNGKANMGNWTLSSEAAVLPWVLLKGTDSHHLRICNSSGCFTGPIPEDGHGWGYQLQAMLAYRVTPEFGLGLGVRYWHMQTRGYTHFEGHVVGQTSIPQPLDWQTSIFGVTAQGTLDF